MAEAFEHNFSEHKRRVDLLCRVCGNHVLRKVQDKGLNTRLCVNFSNDLLQYCTLDIYGDEEGKQSKCICIKCYHKLKKTRRMSAHSQCYTTKENAARDIERMSEIWTTFDPDLSLSQCTSCRFFQSAGLIGHRKTKKSRPVKRSAQECLDQSDLCLRTDESVSLFSPLVSTPVKKPRTSSAQTSPVIASTSNSAFECVDMSDVCFDTNESVSTSVCQSPSTAVAEPRLENEAHLPFWDSGAGHYGNTLGQLSRQMVLSCADLLLSLLDTVPVGAQGVFTFADYGASDGYASLPLIGRVIGHLRDKHGEDLPIQIIYEDQEKNDFNSLFKWLGDSTSYVSRFSNIYPIVSNVNFYRQCVPDSTCDVIFSNASTMFLETLPLTFKNSVLEVFATKEERQRFHAQAEQDWTKFLVLRAKELKQGGLLVIQALCSRVIRDGVGQGKTTLTDCNKEEDVLTQIDLYRDLDAAWKQLKEDKLITQEEYERCTFKMVYRTARESKWPFETEGSAVRQSGLRLVHYEEFISPCVFKAQGRTDQPRAATPATIKADFAASLATAHKVWSQTTFRSSLADMRTDAEKAAILDELYRKFQKLVMSKDPGGYRSDILMSRLVARKA